MLRQILQLLRKWRGIYLNALRVTYSLSRTLLMSLQGCTYVILYELATHTLHARRYHQAYVGTQRSYATIRLTAVYTIPLCCVLKQDLVILVSFASQLQYGQLKITSPTSRRRISWYRCSSVTCRRMTEANKNLFFSFQIINKDAISRG